MWNTHTHAHTTTTTTMYSYPIGPRRSQKRETTTRREKRRERNRKVNNIWHGVASPVALRTVFRNARIHDGSCSWLHVTSVSHGHSDDGSNQNESGKSGDKHHIEKSQIHGE
eukprot:scpid24053/ scgid9059/ 